MSEFDKHSKIYIIIIILQFKLFHRYYFITYLLAPTYQLFVFFYFFLRIKNYTSINILKYKAYFGDIVGLVPDHHNKVNITINWDTHIFGFPVHVKVLSKEKSYVYTILWLPCWRFGKESTGSAGDISIVGLVPESERSPKEGNGTLLQHSCLGNPMDRGAQQHYTVVYKCIIALRMKNNVHTLIKTTISQHKVAIDLQFVKNIVKWRAVKCGMPVSLYVWYVYIFTICSPNTLTFVITDTHLYNIYHELGNKFVFIT